MAFSVPAFLLFSFPLLSSSSVLAVLFFSQDVGFFPSRAGCGGREKEGEGKEKGTKLSFLPPFLFRVDVKGFFLPFPPLLPPPALLSWKQDKRDKIQALKEGKFVFLFLKRTTTMLNKDSNTLSFQRHFKGGPSSMHRKEETF